MPQTFVWNDDSIAANGISFTALKLPRKESIPPNVCSVVLKVGEVDGETLECEWMMRAHCAQLLREGTLASERLACWCSKSPEHTHAPTI